MKKIIFILCLLVGSSALAQSTQQVFSRIRDGSNINSLAAVGQYTLTMPTTTYALAVEAGVYFYDGANMHRWAGAAQNADNIASTTVAPWSGVLSYVWDGAAWDRVSATTAADNLSSTQQGVNTLAYNLFYNGANYQRWTGGTIADGVPATPVAPYVGSLSLFTDGANFMRWRGEAADDNMSMSLQPNVNAATVYFNGANFGIWHGEAYDSSMTAAPNSPNVNAFTAFFNGTASQYWTGEALDDVGTAAAPTLPWVGAYNLFYDGSLARRWTGSAMGDALSGTAYAPYVGSFSLFWNGTNEQRWTGEALDDVGTAAAPTLPWVGAYSLFYDGSIARRWTGSAMGDALSGTAYTPYVGSFSLFWNGTNEQRWTGETIDDSMTNAPVAPFTASYGVFGSLDAAISRRITGEAYDSAMTATPTNPNVNAFNTFYNGSATQYWQGSILSGETVADTTYAPHDKSFIYGHTNGSASWTYVHSLAAQADSQPLTLNSLVTSSMLYGYNAGAATLNLLRLGSSNELYVTDISTRPGEDAANDWVKTKKEQTATVSPDATVGTVLPAGAPGAVTVVLAARDVSSDINFTVYLKNTDGANAFTSVSIETSPDNSVWSSDLGWSACDALAAGAVCSYSSSGNSLKYIRVRASSNAGASCTAWYFANKN